MTTTATVRCVTPGPGAPARVPAAAPRAALAKVRSVVVVAAALALLLPAGAVAADVSTNAPPKLFAAVTEPGPLAVTADATLAMASVPPSDGFTPVLPDASQLPLPTDDVASTDAAVPDGATPDGTAGSAVDGDATGMGGPPAMPLPGAEPIDVATAPPGVRGTWIDAVQTGVYRTVDGTGQWLDGWFGRGDADDERTPTLGRLGLGSYWDERDGFDPSFRLRARVPFDKARNRIGLLFGRGPERELLENRPRAGTNSLPDRFQNVDDDAWLVGLGYSPDGRLGRGFQFDTGVRIRLDPDVYARGVYRWNLEFSDRTLFRPTQTVFWRLERGFGETTDLTLDRLLGDRFMLRTSAAATWAEDTEGLQWNSFVTLFQDLRGRDTMAYSVIVSGETDAEVGLQNYGFQVRYRRRILRDWLFMELLQSTIWPRVLQEEKRELNLGFGLGFEMYFGPVPRDQLR